MAPKSASVTRTDVTPRTAHRVLSLGYARTGSTKVAPATGAGRTEENVGTMDAMARTIFVAQELTRAVLVASYWILRCLMVAAERREIFGKSGRE